MGHEKPAKSESPYPLRVNIAKMLAELRRERKIIDETIAVVGKLVLGARRGGPRRFSAISRRYAPCIAVVSTLSLSAACDAPLSRTRQWSFLFAEIDFYCSKCLIVYC